jgi:hypothetical protein
MISALPETAARTISAGIACNVEAGPFDKFRAELERHEADQNARWAKDKSKRTPRPKTPRASIKIPVNVPEEVAKYRAALCAWASFLPPHLANVMKGAVCASDASGEPVHTSHEVISAYTHSRGLQKRYKVEPVSPRQVERNMRTLREQGFVTTRSETFYDAWDRKLKTDFTLEITDVNIGNLEAVFLRETAAKSERETEKAARKNKQNRLRQQRFRDREAAGQEARNEPRNALRGESGGESGGEHIVLRTNQVVPNQNVPSHHQDRAAARDDGVVAWPLAPGGQAPQTPKIRATLPRFLSPTRTS